MTGLGVLTLCIAVAFFAGMFGFLFGDSNGQASAEAYMRKHFKVVKKTQKECENEGITYRPVD